MFELKPHQEVAVAKMHNGCILCGGVGVGKTHAAVGYYLENEAPKPVYVITTAKKRDKFDWQAVWADVGMISDAELTMGATVIVDSWNNIDKYKEVKDAFFIFDEQRLVGTGTWVKAFYKIAAANHWIMLSATPGDTWLDYVPVFRANGFIKNITQFKEDHVVTKWMGRYYKVIGYRQVPRLVRWRNALLVDMPYERHTTRISIDVPVQYDKATIERLVKERWHVYENRPLTDASELFRVMKRVVYSDESRLIAIRKLIQSHPKLIVFYNHDFELEILRTLSLPQDTSLRSQPPEILRTLSNQTSEEDSCPKTLANDSTTDQSQPPFVLSRDATDSSPNAHTTKQLIQDRSGNTHSSTQSPASKRSHETSSQLDSTTDPDQMASIQEHSPDQWVSESAQEDPWDYLLSPEGMRENASMALTGPEILRSNLETLRTNPSQSYLNDTSKTQSERYSSMKDSSLELTETSNNQKETEEWQKASSSQQEYPKASTSFESAHDTSNDSAGIEKSEESTKSSSTSASSRRSSESSDLSSTGRRPTQSPQFQVAEWNGHKHEAVPTTTSWVYLVQYVAGSEAWECTETDAICFYSMPPSYKNWHQAHGRIDRLNTAYLKLFYYRLFGGSVIELGTALSLKHKKSFNESAFGEQIGIWQI